MKRVCKSENLRQRSPHDLRHTYASILLMTPGISPAYVQRQLGHHSISVTVDIYGHWIPAEGRDKLEDTLVDNKTACDKTHKFAHNKQRSQ